MSMRSTEHQSHTLCTAFILLIYAYIHHICIHAISYTCACVDALRINLYVWGRPKGKKLL